MKRKDVQFTVAFVAGCLFPFVGVAAGTLVSTALWAMAADYYTAQLNVLLNGAVLASVTLVYLGGFIALCYVYARLAHLKLPFTAITRALLPPGLLAIASITFSLQSSAVSANASVWIDLLSVAIFGLGYVLGWWAARRYAKL